MATKITRDMVKAQVRETMAFPQANFGLRVGSDWPEFVTEILKSETVRECIARDFVIANLKARSVDPAGTDPNLWQKLTADPEFVEGFLRWLYIGVRIGRGLAEIEQLEQLLDGSENGRG